MTKKSGMRVLSLIVAVDTAGGFGKNGQIPWNFPEDMKHFKKITNGGICIMGRRTYEDIHNMVKKKAAIKLYEEIENMGSPSTLPIKEKTIKHILPNRQTFVVTSNINYKPEGAIAVTNIRSAIQQLDENDQREIFVLGGYRMFTEALCWANKIYMTVIKNKYYKCDRTFPIQTLNRSYKIVNGQETKKLYFLTYKRIRW